MIYVLYGSDFEKRAKKLNELIQFFLGKKPDVSVTKITPLNFGDYSLDELALGQGLFSGKSVIVIDGLLESKEIKEILLGKLKGLKESENVFVINERAIGKADISSLAEYSEKVQEFAAKAEAKNPEFNIFTLADAIGMRDRRRAWALFLRAFGHGMEPENVHGTIFWQVKNMLAVKNGDKASAEEMGMKPFVYGKAKSFASNYSKEELDKISSNLVSLYHDSHRGKTDFSVGLEQFILNSL